MTQFGADPHVEAHLVVKATGFKREDWFRLLDARKAQSLSTPEIIEWLQTNTKLDAWWSESIAVAYVEARGIGGLGQTPSGHYSTSISRNFAIELPRLFTVLTDLQAWPAQPAARLLARRDNERIQVSFEDASRATITFIEQSASEVTVVVSHELIESEHDARQIEKFWNRLLESFAQRLGV